MAAKPAIGEVLAARGWVAVLLPAGAKAPRAAGWQHLRPSAADVDRHLAGGGNVGILLGPASGGLIDIDLDAAEALAAAQLLPATSAIFGRASKPRSHYLFVADRAAFAAYRDGAVTLVELRTSAAEAAHQTVLPPSTHPSGERIAWAENGAPARIEAPEIARAVAHVAAAGLLARHWPERGNRHSAHLALAGALLRAGWTEDAAAAFGGAVSTAAGDDKAAEIKAVVRDTAARLRRGEAATGVAALAKFVGADVMKLAREWLGLAEPARPAPEHPYAETDSGIIWNRPVTRDGGAAVVAIPLTNFCARISAEVSRDDGIEVQRAFEISATLHGQPAVFTVAASQFAAMNWVAGNLGARAIVYPGLAARDHTRAAIQLCSTEIFSRRVFAHTGWRRFDRGFAYLHAGGGVGATGVETELPGALANFVLPSPPEPEAARAAVAAAVSLFDLLPDEIAFPLFAAPWRAVLGAADFSLHLAGPTGSGKSVIAALAQQFFGAAFRHTALPENWDSTGNRIVASAFAAKDALLVVDDFAPTGNFSRVEQRHAEADRVLRSQGNRAGRGRCAPDGSIRPEKPPRGLIVSTGEDVPRGQSLRARLLVLEVSPGVTPFGKAALRAAQDAGAAGLYAAAMAAFLAWLAPELEARQTEFRAAAARRAAEFQADGQHRRAPGIAGELLAALELFFSFAAMVGALDAAAAQSLAKRARLALARAAAAQAEFQADAEPAQNFISILRSILVSGAAHLAASDGGQPPNAVAFGWRDDSALGPRIGWVEDGGGTVLLDGGAVFAAAQRLATAQGQALAVSQKTLWRRMAERQILITPDTGRNTVVRTLSGARRRVLAIPAAYICSPSGASGVSGTRPNGFNDLETFLDTDGGKNGAPAVLATGVSARADTAANTGSAVPPVSVEGGQPLCNQHATPLAPLAPLPGAYIPTSGEADGGKWRES